MGWTQADCHFIPGKVSDLIGSSSLSKGKSVAQVDSRRCQLSPRLCQKSRDAKLYVAALRIQAVQSDINEVKVEIKAIDTKVQLEINSIQLTINSLEEKITAVEDRLEERLASYIAWERELRNFLEKKLERLLKQRSELRAVTPFPGSDLLGEAKLVRERLWKKESELQQKKARLEQKLEDFLRAQTS